jgi:predicted MPP superfamily phosphohydrolase
MKSGIIRIIIIILLIIIMIDIYSCWSFYRMFLSDYPAPLVLILLSFNILIWLFIMLGIYRFLMSYKKNAGPDMFRNMNVFSGILLVVYIPKLIFIPFSLLADLLLIINALLSKDSELVLSVASLFSCTGLIISLLAVLLILCGIFFGRFNFKLRKYIHTDPLLPEQFEGLKIIQLSDLHTGSLRGLQRRFARVVRIVNEHSPDLIFFTGDMINNFAEELDGWIETWSGLTAKQGKYAVLGNHDYGEYFNWPDRQSRQDNLNRLSENIESMGFRLLMNESVRIDRNGEHITIIGTENWGIPPFSQYGDLVKAMENTDGSDFKVLLSHDPSHWEAQVLRKTNINLTLSGHTHGFQFGIRIGKLRWSPARIKYPQWRGWYKEGDQYLHVSTGLGYIGFPFRLGMPPEVVLIRLRRGNGSDQGL